MLNFKKKADAWLAKNNGLTTVIFLALVIAPIIWLLSADEKSTTIALQSAGDSTTTVATTKYFSQEQICKAAIGTIMRRDPSTMKISKTEAGVTYLSYVRENDGSNWAYRCKLENDKIIWATDTGRWRTHSEDSVITYSETAQEIKIVEIHGDGSSTSDIYTELQLQK